MTAKILIPVDVTGNSKTAEDYAIKLHQKMPLTAILLNVVNTKELDGHGLDPGLKETVLAQKRKRADKALSETASAFEEAGIKYEKIIQAGDPGNLICYTAHTENVDMVVMSESGLGDFKDWFMGSVTNYILYRCPVPVLLVKHPYHRIRDFRK